MPKGVPRNTDRKRANVAPVQGRPRSNKGKAINAAVITKRREEIARMYLLRKTQHEIASHLGISQPLVAIDLKAIQEAWRLSAVRDFDAHKAEQLAAIDDTERIAMEQFEISKRPERFVGKRTKRRRARDEEGDGAEATLSAVEGVDHSTRGKVKMTGPKIVAKMRAAQEGMVVVEENVERTKRGRGEGNPDWLRVRQWCIQQRCLILKLLDTPDTVINNNLGVNWDSIHAPVKEGDTVEERIQEAEVLAIAGPSPAPDP